MDRATRAAWDDAAHGHGRYFLDDPDQVISLATHDGLRGEGERFVGDLLGLLHSVDSAIRTAAATALGMIGDERAVDSLRAASEDPDSTVAAAAAPARPRLGDETAPHPSSSAPDLQVPAWAGDAGRPS